MLLGLTILIALAQATSRNNLFYRRDDRSVEICLQVLFFGSVTRPKRRHFILVHFSKHLLFLRWWWDTHTHQTFREVPARPHHTPPQLVLSLTNFLRAAQQDGWVFGQRKSWTIPEWVFRDYPKLLLTYWALFAARLYLFVTRQENPDRSAVSLLHINRCRAPMKRLQQWLVSQGIPCALQCTQVTRYHRFPARNPLKHQVRLAVYGFTPLQALFKHVNPLYLPFHHRVRVFARLAERRRLQLT